MATADTQTAETDEKRGREEKKKGNKSMTRLETARMLAIAMRIVVLFPLQVGMWECGGSTVCGGLIMCVSSSVVAVS